MINLICGDAPPIPFAIGIVYYNDKVRCHRNGQVERYWKKDWQIVKNNNNHITGYNYITINKKLIGRHKIIAYCFLGLDNIVMNKKVIDHIDNDKSNNAADNLRISNVNVNQQNITIIKGYSFNKRRNKYEATIVINYNTFHLGYYDNEEEAHNAYLEAKKNRKKYLL